jgi:hypothetical protein
MMTVIAAWSFGKSGDVGRAPKGKPAHLNFALQNVNGKDVPLSV